MEKLDKIMADKMEKNEGIWMCLKRNE
jgi:hypothetical protein